MIRVFLSLLIMCSVFLISHSQSSDSLAISGTLLWDKEGISGFPNTLKVTDVADNTLVKNVTVDSLGHFKTQLTTGKYRLEPSRSYHWQGEDIVRVDMINTQQEFEVSNGQPKSDIVLTLRTINKPQRIPDQGILHKFNDYAAKDINAFVKAYMSYYEVPGASLAIIKNGEVVFHNHYGVKNSATNEEVNAETLFEAGSITKTVLAFIAMRIYEKGLLNLDQPLYQYQSFEDISHDDRYKKITARMVLSHRTGFPNWARGKFDLKFEPGTKFGYSGEAFEYLKRVLEAVTDKSMSELIKDEFLTPLKLKDIYFKGSEFEIGLAANGHKFGGDVSEKRDIKSPMMAFSMVTNALAFAQFAMALRNRKGLKADTYDELFKIHSTRDDGTHWGLGFRIEETKFGRTYGHSGSTNPGFIGNYVYYDALDMGYVVITNSQTGGWLSLPLLTQFLITGKDNP
ncbi:MAG: serine hydrolase domain-containing protein [Bacteroidota bacterium]